MAVLRLTLALVAVVAGMAASGRTALGQNPSAVDPAFEEASIRPNLSGRPQMMIRTPASGLVTATNVNVQMLVRYAFGLPEVRIVDLPEWAIREHFEVTARGPAEAPAEVTRAMIRRLLADRFGLVARTTQRDMDIETLTRAGAALGPGLRPASPPCETTPDGRSNCGLFPGYGSIRGVRVGVGELARALTLLNRRNVVDATGIEGLFDFTLTYTPDDIALDPSTRAQFPNIDPDGPALATALREQLGLRLTRGRGSVEVLVVERLTRPELDGDAVR